MRVKIGDKIIDSTYEPIIIVLSREEKDLISNMDEQDYHFCSFPESFDLEELLKFMKEEQL